MITPITSFKGSKEEFDERYFFHLTRDDIEDMEKDCNTVAVIHDAMTREQRMGHVNKAVAYAHSMARMVAEIKRKLNSHLNA